MTTIRHRLTGSGSGYFPVDYPVIYVTKPAGSGGNYSVA